MGRGIYKYNTAQGLDRLATKGGESMRREIDPARTARTWIVNVGRFRRGMVGFVCVTHDGLIFAVVTSTSLYTRSRGAEDRY